ncbi:MAG: hypothetical protein SVY15_02960, partial [Halobacteriota archaeon]|nr:hypothetical protein [Halobacteriota archaeon]
PTKILEVIGKDVKKESVILAHKDKKRSDFVVKEDDESDPLQPLRDIANNAISMSNHEVARLAINKIVEKGIELLKDEKDKDDAAKIAEHFVYHLEKIGTNAVSSKDPDFIDLVIGAMDSIAKTSKTDGGMKPFIQSLGYIGRECAEENMIVISDTSNDDIIYVIKNLGILAVDNGFTGENSSSQAAIFKIHEIGSILLKKEFKFLLIGSIVSVLKEIAEQGIKKEKRSVVSYAVENIASYALSAIDFPPFHKFVTKDGIDALKSIAIYSDKAGLKSIKPQVIEDLEKILKKADEKGLDEVVTHAEKAITELKGNTKSDDSLEGQN